MCFQPNQSGMNLFQARINSFQSKFVWNEFIPSQNGIIPTQDNANYNDDDHVADYDDDDNDNNGDDDDDNDDLDNDDDDNYDVDNDDDNSDDNGEIMVRIMITMMIMMMMTSPILLISCSTNLCHN